MIDIKPNQRGIFTICIHYLHFHIAFASAGQQTGSYCGKPYGKCPALFLKIRLDATGAAIRTCYLLIFSEKLEKGQVSYFWLNIEASTNKNDESIDLRIRQLAC